MPTSPSLFQASHLNPYRPGPAPHSEHDKTASATAPNWYLLAPNFCSVAQSSKHPLLNRGGRWLSPALGALFVLTTMPTVEHAPAPLFHPPPSRRGPVRWITSSDVEGEGDWLGLKFTKTLTLLSRNQ